MLTLCLKGDDKQISKSQHSNIQTVKLPIPAYPLHKIRGELKDQYGKIRGLLPKQFSSHAARNVKKTDDLSKPSGRIGQHHYRIFIEHTMEGIENAAVGNSQDQGKNAQMHE